MNCDFDNNYDDSSLLNSMQDMDSECDGQSNDCSNSFGDYQSNGNDASDSNPSFDDKLKSTVQDMFILKTIEEQEHSTSNVHENSWRGNHPLMYDFIKLFIYAVIAIGLILFIVSNIFK